MSGVLITGGSQRLGSAIAHFFAAKGYDILIHCNSSEHAARTLAQDLATQHKVRTAVHKANLLKHDQVEGLISHALECFPDLSVLVNNASIFEDIGIFAVDEADWEQNFAIHCKAPFFLSRHFARHICNEQSSQSSGGQIINLLDTRISRVNTDHFAYSLSKTCLATLTTMLAKALAPSIRVNGVCPGLILPPPGKDIDYLQKKSEGIPLRRHGGTADILQAFEYLLNSSFVTGQCLFVDGGEQLS